MTSMRGVGEPIDGNRRGEALSECQVHEELLNVAFDGSMPLRLLCPYDADTLSASIIPFSVR